jgi:hypothetical protein
MKSEIDDPGKLREPFVRLPGEPDHWTFYLKVGDCVCYACSRADSFQGKARNQSWNLAEILQ